MKDAIHGLPLPWIRLVEDHHVDEDDRTGVHMTATVDIKSVALGYPPHSVEPFQNLLPIGREDE